MKTILVRFYNPKEVIDLSPRLSLDAEIRDWCFRVDRYDSEESALCAYEYYKRGCKWVALLVEDTDVDKWIDNAYTCIKLRCTDWLKRNFVYHNPNKRNFRIWNRKVMWRIRQRQGR